MINIQRLSQLIGRQVSEGTMDLFTPCFFLENSAIDIGTRYFTSRKDDPMSPSAPFDHAIDPKGILMAMADDRHFYGTDNMVQYYVATQSEDDIVRWENRVQWKLVST